MARPRPPKPPEADLVIQPPPAGPDPTSAAEERFWRRVWNKENAEVAGSYIDLGLRLVMCAALLRMSWIWLDKVGDVVEKQSDVNRKPLSDAVMVALLTTTTATVLGLLLIVVNYLFPKRFPDSRPEPPRP